MYQPYAKRHTHSSRTRAPSTSPRHASARGERAQTMSWTRQYASRLDALVLPFPSSCACTLHTMPRPRQTPPLALACVVDDAIIKPLPRLYRKDGDDAARSCPPLAMPSSALAPPRRRLPPAPMPLPFRVLDRRRHRRPAAPPRPPLRPINSDPLSLPFPHQTCSTPSSEPPQRQLPFV